jgi:hypothetical protein
LQTRVVDEVQQGVDADAVEATTEVAGRGGIGNTPRSEGVEEVLVLASQFQVLQTGAVAQGVVGDREDMVGLVIGQMDLEEMEALVNAVDESEPTGEEMKGAEAAVSDTPRAVADLVVQVAGGEHGLGAASEVRLVETTLNPALTLLQLSVYRRVHSKTLGTGVNGETVYSSYIPEKTRVFEFFSACQPSGRELFAYSRASCARHALRRQRNCVLGRLPCANL